MPCCWALNSVCPHLCLPARLPTCRLSLLAGCQVRDAGNLLTRAGLAIPAVDVDEIQVHYADAVQLVQHLR